MNISELTGEALDLAVAQCEGHDVDDPTWWADFGDDCCYSTEWAKGGPIIEREKISVNPSSLPCNDWVAETKIISEKTHQYGLTPLIAAMRCYVASKQGATL